MTTDERFVEACKKAARLRSDKFLFKEYVECKHKNRTAWHDNAEMCADCNEVVSQEGHEIKTIRYDIWNWRFYVEGSLILIDNHPVTQDNIDAMAAALGWEYWFERWSRGWGWIIELTKHPPITPKSNMRRSTVEEIYSDKLTAAKEAFIAIVEQIEKHSP